MNMRTYKPICHLQSNPRPRERERVAVRPGEGAQARVPESFILHPPSSILRSRGIALVITLLMLSVITFLAIALLVLTRTHRESVTASIDLETAKAASQTALARAESEIIAHMMAHHDLVNYDYMGSRTFINPYGFTNGVANPNNVNYDFDSNGVPMSPTLNPQGWAQNIANLWFDPRPPVFIKTNASPLFPADFRFWVDLNRNGRFETNGYLPVIGNDGRPVQDPNNLGFNLTNFFNGEPEWIGVLQYPEYPHSATNRFIMRYAYLVLPIGKTLDFNYIHNYVKALAGGAAPWPMPPVGARPVDQFVRDQGVGSWELNLAGLLWGLAPDIYNGNYNYFDAARPNSGSAFDDAYSFLRFRYNASYGGPYPLSLSTFFGSYTPNYFLDGIDEYGILGASSYPLTTDPWPGGYATNNFYNTYSDVFNPNKTSPFFVNRLLTAGSYTNSNDRYLFQRLLAAIGTGSAPELQTWVYDDPPRFWNTNLQAYPNPVPTRLRTKVNLNYDNSYEITNGLNTSPPFLVPWTNSLAFFTNAAESLLRSQEFRTTNYNLFYPTNMVYLHFGLTNIPVYSSNNPSIRYTEQLHRMLQLAANIYDATRIYTNTLLQALPVPSVFRPLFFTTNYGGTNQVLYIVGYAKVTTDASSRIQNMFLNGLKLPSDPTIKTNDNVWGIPWVIGAVKGLPAFDRYVSGTSWAVTRKLLFKRYTAAGVPAGAPNGNPALHPNYTNQFLVFSITNIVGLDAWNAYKTNISLPGSFTFTALASVSIILTNNSFLNPGGFAYTFPVSTNYSTNFWPGLLRGTSSGISGYTTNGMLAFLQTNVASMSPAYFSDIAAPGKFIEVWVDPTNDLGYDYGLFLTNDLAQRTWPVYDWTLSVTNRVMYALVDPYGNALDFVNLGPFGTNLDLTNILISQTHPSHTLAGGTSSGSTVPEAMYWDPTPVPGRPSQGVLNQISNGLFLDPYFAAELAGSNTVVIGGSNVTINSNLFFSCSNDVVATVFTGVTNALLVNDPLVHYTVGDLTPPSRPPSSQWPPMILTLNSRYTPWPTPSHTNTPNMTLQDPLIYQSDDWSFPGNKFPSIGWLGRVHRGTPWQTVFLKADPPTVVNGVNQNQNTWISSWVSTLDTYPTNDYALLDLFTAAPNDNAARGLLSVNQTNDAPWYALFSGIALNTNIPAPQFHSPPGPPAGPEMVLDPTVIAPLLEGMFIITNDSNGRPVTNYLAGINATRGEEPDQNFHSLGRVFNSPMLSINSPFLPGFPAGAGAFKDEEVEAIPQQVAGLLKLGQPQFVIYGFGQALKPKDIYFGGPPNFNLCTNYQITGEFVTRTVCHVVGDPTAASVKIQVDSFNILPAD